MSRIIVKNLPEGLTDEKLKGHFSQHGGIITDCKLMKTRSGKSRRFAFIGYRSVDDAKEAVKYFNKTFIGMARLDVDIAKTFIDASVAVPSRLEKRIFIESGGQSKRQRIEDSSDKPVENTRLAEYLDAMKSRTNERSWENESFSLAGPDSISLSEKPEMDTSTSVDDTHFDSRPIKRAATESGALNENSSSEISEANSNNEASLAPVLRDTSSMTDEEWMLARRKRIVDENTEEQEISVVDSSLDADVLAASQESNHSLEEVEQVVNDISETEKNCAIIRSTKRLFLRNLSFICSEDDLRELFSPFGTLEEVHIPLDSVTHNSKGIAYVLFENGSGAERSYLELDKQSFQGRLLHILPGQPKRKYEIDELELAKLPLKKQNEIRRKIAAARSQFSWNSLYMNADTVVESLAQKMGVSKSALLDPESTDAAVRQALAEAHAIDDAKTYFESVGVNLKAFSDPKSARSDTIILAKNFPFETKVDELRSMFEQYGEVSRVFIPPSNTIAVIEMAHAPDARTAFAKLAYRRMKNSVLYLEKAPKDLITSTNIEAASAKSLATGVRDPKASAQDIIDIGKDDDSDVESALPTTSLFVKNLNFKTQNSDLASAFQPLQDFVRAEVKMKKDPKHPGQLLSMGFGFVEFRSRVAAEIAMKTMNEFILDGHKLQIKLSTRGSDQTPSVATAKISRSVPKTKIIVKNLPFEATKRDIRQLLGAFGQLRTVRLPKKFDNTIRGFAFAEFISAKEAENAMASLEGVHLLGRRLVLQYASSDAISAEEEIEKMRGKVQRQVATESASQHRISGKRKFDLEGNNLDEEEE
ncbi:hypothetical protein V1511DRAFT_527760 [Dipodascopsis uninucleata]